MKYERLEQAVITDLSKEFTYNRCLTKGLSWSESS